MSSPVATISVCCSAVSAWPDVVYAPDSAVALSRPDAPLVHPGIRGVFIARVGDPLVELLRGVQPAAVRVERYRLKLGKDEGSAAAQHILHAGVEGSVGDEDDAGLTGIELLGKRAGAEVTILTITVDPVNDTPASLKKYAEQFKAGPGWYFLSGAPGNGSAVLKNLGGLAPKPGEPSAPEACRSMAS